MTKKTTESSEQAAGGKKASVMDRLLVVIFCVLMAAPVTCQLLHIDLKGGADDEKRKTAEFPKVPRDVATLRAFPGGFDAWFLDNFGLRRALIRLHSAIVYFGLHSSPNTKIIVGKNGWLYYNSAAGNDGTDSITDFRGTRPLTSAQLENWRWTFQDENDWCVANGIKFLLVIVPAKETLYPENTPDWMTRVAGKSAREQLGDYLREKAAFPWLDLTGTLREGMKRDRVWLLTDTHWTRFGAYCGWREIMARITNDFPAVRLPPDSEFQLTRETFYGGDLAQIMSLRPVMSEEYVMMKPLTPPRAKTEIAFGRELPDIVATTGDTNLPRVAVFRDSFTEDLMPFLSECFQRTAYSWARVGVEFGTIQREKPQIVLHIMGDRMIRKGLRYPTQMRNFCSAQRFAASTNIMLRAEDPRALGKTVMKRGDAGWIVTVGKNPPRIELGKLTGDTAKLLPIVRLDVTMPAQTDLHISWRDAEGKEHDMRADRAGGRHEIFFPLVEPGVDGPLILRPGHRAGDYILHSAEVRAVPR